MARILICHVPKDASPARDLGAALMGRGHFVSFDGEPDTPRHERASRLRQFEAVIVLWTETSAQNAGLADIARETMPLNLLVPVRAEELALTKLPLMFRKLVMLTPRDTEGIARVVARMNTAASSLRDMTEREAARRSAGAPVAEQSSGAPAVPPPIPQRAPPSAPAAGRRAPSPAVGGAKRSAQSAVTAPAAPVVGEPAARIRVRPLSDLPEVEAGPDLTAQPPAYPPPHVPAPHTEHAPVRPPYETGNVAPRHAGPQRATAVPLTADDLGRAVDAGLLVHHIPAAMWLGAPTTVEIAIGREILSQLAQTGHGQGTLGQSIETLSVSLYGSSEAFEIERQSERTQFVSIKHALAARDPATFGRWVWLVTPGAAGPHDLVVRISALLRDPRGVPAPVAIPDRRFSVDIQIPEDETLGSAFAGWYRR
ncbi:hypothetical protein [uncultured Hyphomicrobium sp.]|uniref:hypothetical protein n=1 Tax=uncultured Hyphomicrobium sp. TaxID=194373 RepID=UPI0026011A9C|nr:hypothetical protein [uncultured Hyphomicrobium sp.]